MRRELATRLIFGDELVAAPVGWSSHEGGDGLVPLEVIQGAQVTEVGTFTSAGAALESANCLRRDPVTVMNKSEPIASPLQRR